MLCGNVLEGTTGNFIVNISDALSTENSNNNNKTDSDNNCIPERNAHEGELYLSLNDSKNQQHKRIFGMKCLQEDWKYHTSTYRDEWTRRPKSIRKVVEATIYSFCTQIIPALIFADLLDTMTNGSIGVVETMLSSGIIGVVYSIITGQSLVLLGITGPVAILLGTSYGLAETFNTDYYSFFFYICIWTSLLHIISAMSDTIMSLVNYITSFTSSIFEFFIGITFIYESLRDLIRPLQLFTSLESSTAVSNEASQQDSDHANTATSAWISLVIGFIAFGICFLLHFANNWMYFNRPIREFLSSYSMIISVVIVTAFSYLPGIPNDKASSTSSSIKRVNVTAPWNGKPSDISRTWVINPTVAVSSKCIAGALFPAIMLYLLFFIDHNISSILTQDPKFNLKKKPTYSWDFFCLGITIIPCAILGLPPGSGLIPQAPLHTRALATQELKVEDGVTNKVTTYVEEQRYSALGQSLLMLLSLGAFHAIALIPKSALYGIFLYLGVVALYNNEIWHRLLLMAVMEENRSKIQRDVDVKWSTIRIYTVIEIICALIIFAVANFASIGYVFPALVTALVPFRFYVLSRCFNSNDLKRLDPFVQKEVGV